MKGKNFDAMRTSLSIDFYTLKGNGSSIPHTDLHSKRLSVDLDYPEIMGNDRIGTKDDLVV